MVAMSESLLYPVQMKKYQPAPAATSGSPVASVKMFNVQAADQSETQLF